MAASRLRTKSSLLRKHQQAKRNELIDRLIADDRFVDRWTVFYADMFRLRAQADGAERLWLGSISRRGRDASRRIVRRLITTNGKAGAAPEVAFVLGDNAGPHGAGRCDLAGLHGRPDFLCSMP